VINLTDYEVHQGVDKILPINITDDDEALDISGASLIFTVKNEEEEVIRKTESDGITVLDEDNGQIEISINGEDSNIAKGIYIYELLLVDASDNHYVALKGDFHIKESITKDEVV